MNHRARPVSILGCRGAVQVVTLYIAFLFVLPARLVFRPLGGIGRPEVLIGLGGLAWWALDRILVGRTRRGSQPVRYLLLGFLGAFALSYLAGLDRGLPGIEARAMDRSLIFTLSLAGVVLVMVDAVRTRRDLDLLLWRLCLFGGFLGLVGTIQFTTGFDPVPYLRLPGLALNDVLYGFTERGAPGFRRVPSTAGHAIEFGVVSAMILPIALHYALHTRDNPGKRQLAWGCVIVLALAVPFSLSRSGTLSLVAVLLMLLPVWSGEMLKRFVVVGTVGVLLLRGAIPGLIGTMRSLFLNLGNDPSIEGRTNDYDVVWTFIRERPFFGRGPRTFIPDEYRVLDNQYLDSLITMGWIGTVALVALLVGGMLTARRIYVVGVDDSARHLAQAMAGSVLAAIIVSATFDSLSFTMFTGTLFIVLGAVGALWRLDRDGDLGSDYSTSAFVLLARPRSQSGSSRDGTQQTEKHQEMELA